MPDEVGPEVLHVLDGVEDVLVEDAVAGARVEEDSGPLQVLELVVEAIRDELDASAPHRLAAGAKSACWDTVSSGLGAATTWRRPRDLLVSGAGSLDSRAGRALRSRIVSSTIVTSSSSSSSGSESDSTIMGSPRLALKACFTASVNGAFGPAGESLGE